MAGIHVKFEVTPEQFLSDLTDAAYQVALRYGLRARFDQVELDLLTALRQVIQDEMQVSRACGISKECCEAMRHEPWSEEACKLFKEDS